MTSIHGPHNSVVDYVIFDILVYNKIVNFDILNDHEPNFDHIPLMLTLNFFMHKNTIIETCNNEKKFTFNKNKVYLFLIDL